MLEDIKAYIKFIAVFMIFISFAEMLFPENNFKKFINIFMGFMIIAVILSPLNNFMNYNINFYNNISNYYNKDDIKEFAYSEYMKKMEKEVEKDIYKFSNENYYENVNKPKVIVRMKNNSFKDFEILIYCDIKYFNEDKILDYIYEKYGVKNVIIRNE